MKFQKLKTTLTQFFSIQNRKKLTAFGVVVVIIASVAVVLWQKENSLEEFSAGSISFKYPKEYEGQPVPKPKINQAKTLVKLKAEDPLSYIELAVEEGAIKGANVTKTNFLDFLEKNAGMSLPRVYKDYKELHSGRIKISGRDAAAISFSYTGADSKTKIYMKFFIIPFENDAYYLTIQSVDKSKFEKDASKIQPTMTLR
ncbi:MAG: hypothetical protein A2Z11_03145 [Candidatus Woykebacteria bacterium RBG_16_43_9]|uniref:Uncharacterized protein n=1 Tax=Candidatus Woykebacteria bacterium RBG_16_43_9 TaxID=1802596 RepID=A0A1G1WEU5_9BACT|nr:MAG: hypothetical protein A2Z11_03145 [Candidatus Woykebacteria bacterium RBG_16_43_9]